MNNDKNVILCYLYRNIVIYVIRRGFRKRTRTLWTFDSPNNLIKFNSESSLYKALGL